jgi:hypothetical protein
MSGNWISPQSQKLAANMTQTLVKVWVLTTCLGASVLMVGLTGCAGDRRNESTGHRVDENRPVERAFDQSTDQRMEDSRTAQRVREALAAGADSKYDSVRVIASDGAVHLSGYVNTSAHRTHAGEVANQVVSVKSVENNLTVKD